MALVDEGATLELAQRFAARLKPGMVIYLSGDLGAGKTTLVRGVLNALGYSGRVPWSVPLRCSGGRGR